MCLSWHELGLASPLLQEYMAEIEVRAAHNVLEACARTKTIEKVVFTSSITAVIWSENRKSAPDFSERNWSDPIFCKKFKVLLTSYYNHIHYQTNSN